MGAPRSLVAIAMLAGGLTGCDPRAKAADPPGARAEAKSKEYESCGASMHCQDDLRCFGNMCRRIVRSTVGDYYAALGAASKLRGELELAIDSYNKALGHYDSEKVALPPDLDCAYGATLTAAKANKEHAELAARVLHRCVLAVPVGSALRDGALAELANLTEAGLDPLALGRSQLADVYLTRAAQKPASDKLQVTVTPVPAVDKKTFPMVTERLAQPDIKAAMVACWEAYNQATKKDALTVGLPIKWAYLAPEFDDEAGKFLFKMDPSAGVAPGPELTADQCARAAVEPALKGLTTVRDAFATKLTITIK